MAFALWRGSSERRSRKWLRYRLPICGAFCYTANVARGYRIQGVFLLLAFTAIMSSPDGIGAPPVEKSPLFNPGETKGWSVAESSLVPSDQKAPDGSPLLHWHVNVDHNAGEVNYPIGWPRFGRAITDPALRDWSAWDSLHIWLRADTTRPALPREPLGLGLHTPDKSSSFQRPLSELRKGDWLELEIPMRDIPRHGDVRQIQFHIAESKYRHGDQLDLLVSIPELRRPARPTLVAFAPERAIMYADSRQIPVRIRVAGVKSGQNVMVSIGVLGGGKKIIETTADLGRGEHRVDVDAASARLEPGLYEIEAQVSGDEEKKIGRLRMVESPWAK